MDFFGDEGTTGGISGQLFESGGNRCLQPAFINSCNGHAYLSHRKNDYFEAWVVLSISFTTIALA